MAKVSYDDLVTVYKNKLPNCSLKHTFIGIILKHNNHDVGYVIVCDSGKYDALSSSNRSVQDYDSWYSGTEKERQELLNSLNIINTD